MLELNTLGDRDEPARLSRGAGAPISRATGNGCRQDSLVRLERNPMRILDSKDEGDRAVVADAPLLHEHLNQASRDFFARVQEGLARLGIAFELSPRLVRGLDYYTHTAFEFTTTALGAQGAVMAGGRYDGLMREMGGPDVPGRRLGGRGGAPGHAAGRRPPPDRARRDRADRRGGRGGGLRRWPMSCAVPGSPSTSPSRASPGSA